MVDQGVLFLLFGILNICFHQQFRMLNGTEADPETRKYLKVTYLHARDLTFFYCMWSLGVLIGKAKREDP